MVMMRLSPSEAMAVCPCNKKRSVGKSRLAENAKSTRPPKRDELEQELQRITKVIAALG
jgi:hypothetical protein